MRKAVVIALCLVGCGDLFELNPDYGSTGDVGEVAGETTATIASASSGSTSATAESTGPSLASSSSSEGETNVATCDEDLYESNDGQTEVASLGDIIGEGPFEIIANIETSADEDWFKTSMSPTGSVQPSPVATVDADAALEVCVYVGCADGTPVVDCGALQVDSTGSSGNGNPGCCAIGSARVLSYTCEGAIELTGNAYARIRASEPIDACIPYLATFASE